ncbi:MAG TPA: biopolymer transporter ExbD [Spirochaetia bacterium]|nr:biopolymer transporter ExbD [Spirochaetaceae bacterium]HPE90260.1 biopolymer transporter ExbD [Spirochaetales bacterium]HRW23218.1 biopolymer transporter ExbD [Spirochaetia bacterium]
MTIERRLKPQINIDLTPLIDIIFQLVIFFMISSTFKTAPGIELQLPDSGTATAITITELSVVAVSEDEVYVNKTRTTAEGAESVIKLELEGKQVDEVQAVLEAGAEAPYQLVVTLLDSLRKNGVDSVGLSTRPSGEAAP